jgi:hypothetical protein
MHDIENIITAIYTSIWGYVNQHRKMWKYEKKAFFSKLIALIKSDKVYFDVLRKTLACKYEIITIDENINGTGLDDFNISLKNLYESLRLGLADKTFNWKDTEEKEGVPRDFKKEYGKVLRFYQEETISNGFLEIVCPFSGKLIRTVHSFPIGRAVFYRFESEPGRSNN